MTSRRKPTITDAWDFEPLLIIDKRIDASESESMRDRWEFGRLMLVGREGKKRLPNGYLAALIERTGKSRSELGFRSQFAEQYPTEAELSNALDSFTSWHDVVANLARGPNSGTSAMTDGVTDEVITPTRKTSEPEPEPDQVMQKRQNVSPVKPTRKTAKARRLMELLEVTIHNLSLAVEDELTDPNEVDYQAHKAEIEQMVKELNTIRGFVSQLKRQSADGQDALEDEATVIDWASIPKTAKEKLDGARRQIRKDTEREYRNRLLAEVNKNLAVLRADLASHKAALDAEHRRLTEIRNKDWQRYLAVIKAHKGAFTRTEYDLIRSCLHPDSRMSASDEKLGNAFRVFNEAQMVLVNEKYQPTKRTTR